MAELSIVTFGGLRVTLRGEPLVGFRTDKERALLAYLAIEVGRPHRREMLVGLLWPDFPEPNARHTLSQALTDLRRLLDDRARASPYLDTTRATVMLANGGQMWVDVREFDALLCRTPADPGAAEVDAKLRADDLECIAHAVTLYQGDFLSGFSLGDAPAFEEWQLLQRERLRRRVAEALTRLVGQHTTEGAYDIALPFAWRLVELDPWQESGQRQLIRLLALTGQRGAALRQCELCNRILKDELGVKPDEETRALYRAVRAGTVEGASLHHRTAPASSVTAGTRRIETVPIALMPLIGRETEMEQLTELLEDPNVRLLTLVGPGGIGKTCLALELAAIHASDFADGAYVVPLAAATSWDACIAAIAQAMGFVASELSDAIEQQLLRYLSGKSLLLLLDSFEQLVAHAPSVVRLLQSAERVRVIATSRERLGVLGEVVFAVEALSVPEEGALSLTELRDVAAVKLFVHSARRVENSFRLLEDNKQAVAAICQQLEGIPLALLLAASWVDTLGPRQILARLLDGISSGGDQPIDFLRASWPDVPARQRSMRAVFDHSWRLIRVREQAILQALTVFRGGFTLEAAYAVSGATLREIRRLVEQSLINRASGERYWMQELLRQYTAELLANAPVAERVARDRHAAYYVNALRRWFEEAKGPRQVAALAEMDFEIDNAQAAWEWVVAQGDVPQIGRAVDGLCLYYIRRVRPQAVARACAVALTGLDQPKARAQADEGTKLETMARLLIWQSQMVRGAVADEAVEKALEILSLPGSEAVDVRVARGRALRRKADLSMSTDRQCARALYEESLAVLKEAGDRWEVARVLTSLAWLTLLTTDFEANQAYGEDLLRISRSLGDLQGLAYGLTVMSGNALYQGRTEEATRLAEEGLAVRRELGQPLELAGGLSALALRRLCAGRFDQAFALYDETLDIMDRLGLPTSYPRGIKAWGLMLAGRYDAARALVQRALDEACSIGQRRMIAWNEHVLGGLALANGEVDGAIARLAYSVNEFRALGESAFLGMMLSFLGYAYRANGERDRACACFIEALQIGVKVGASPNTACALPGIAMLYADAGRAERARALVAVVKQCCVAVVGTRWFADVAGPAYHAAMAALSPEQIAEAERSVLLSDMVSEAQAVLAELGEDAIL